MFSAAPNNPLRKCLHAGLEPGPRRHHPQEKHSKQRPAVPAASARSSGLPVAMWRFHRLMEGAEPRAVTAGRSEPRGVRRSALIPVLQHHADIRCPEALGVKVS